MLRPVPIDPGAVYDDGAVSLALDIPAATLARARREGRLRFTRQGRRVFYLGQWLLDWLTCDSAVGTQKGGPERAA
jgi:hypothetical protein